MKNTIGTEKWRMRVLHNEKVELDGLQIIGVDYRDTRREVAFRSILKCCGNMSSEK